MVYRARARQLGYGRPIGILMLEEHIPCPPGTPGNPTTFAHPVCYEIVRGLSSTSLEDPVHPDGLDAFIAAGRALVERGACAVAGNCGLMIVHQQQLAGALPVPVLLSSLLQLPWIARMLAPGAAVGVLASNHRGLKAGHLRIALAGAEVPVAMASMEGREYFRAAVAEQRGTLDFERVQAEVVDVARELVASDPAIGAILFECVDLPPYAHAVQEAVELPVFDITTLIAHACSGLVRRPFSGVY
jgi:hypothetical protein